MTRWSFGDRASLIDGLERQVFDVVIVGGGITGAGVLRDASLRGLKALLVERDDFASGTSGATSKMIHGGLRYLAERQFAVTRQSSVERALLQALNPGLVRPLPFLLLGFEGGLPPWKVKMALRAYRLLASRHGEYAVLTREQLARHSRDVPTDRLRIAALFQECQVDDARFVLETIKSARRQGGEALNHLPLVGFVEDDTGRLRGVRVVDRQTRRELSITAHVVVNATGATVERIRSLQRRIAPPRLRPSKGIHVVIPRGRLHADCGVSLQASDGRHMFVYPWGDVHVLGTTDTFTHEGDSSHVRRDEVAYVLDAANRLFGADRLGFPDVVSVFSGVRPLLAAPAAALTPSSVSRRHEVLEDPSGLISIAGGKLTTHRAMAEEVVDLALRRLPQARSGQAGPCRTRVESLRPDSLLHQEVANELRGHFALPEHHVGHLVDTWGAEALTLIAQAPPSARRPIGTSRYLFAELAWSWQHDLPGNLCDLLERRVRLAVLAGGQGLGELESVVRHVAEVAGWSDGEQQEQMARYRARVRDRYQLTETDICTAETQTTKVAR